MTDVMDEETKVALQSQPSSHPIARLSTLYLSSLSLNHFRNYNNVRIAVDARPVVLTGRNGSGKTNILEAISLLIPGRGLRKARLGEIDNVQNPAGWSVAATVHGMQGESKIGTGRDTQMLEGDKRLVRIDGKPAKSQAELGQHLAMIWLTPQMEQLFNESGGAQRRFLDRLVYSFDPEHASRVNEYEFAMRERNRLLGRGQGDAPWLDALEQTMAETGCAIASARLHTVDNINHAIGKSDLSFPKAHLTIRGMFEDAMLTGMSAAELEEMAKKCWFDARRDDGFSGRTLAGIHRSELFVTHIEKNMPAPACSTGEQKALLLSVILAQARASLLWRGIVPILLLDEIISHLDPTRKLELFEEICQIGAQTWMTGTDASLFVDLGEKAQYFQVENGTII